MLDLVGGPYGLAILLAGVAAGGFVNGLTGFGTALASMPFLLVVFEPIFASQISALIGIVSQLLLLHEVLDRALWRRMTPMLIGGFLGIPVGTWLAPHIPAAAFKTAVGLILVIYASSMLRLAGRFVIARGGPWREAPVGLFGGILGGLAGLSGVLPTIQAAVEGWPKDERRQAFRVFNFAILSGTIAAHVATGLATTRLLVAGLMAIPVTLIAVNVGSAVYRRLDERRFDRVVLLLLLLAGLALIANNLFRR